ncbi:hypothetical protein LM184_09870 [Escherichia coli]|uniref:hypothetical protein n=1 Tax=Escherichia coli TaxID=562 RepID=UPI001E554C46|nr:hypothetical protein [Escherichia coli]MCC6084940.1 hypothetical protein [Escherichia coli]
MRLFIAEKPSLAKAIFEGLGGNPSKIAFANDGFSAIKSLILMAPVNTIFLY